MTEHRPGAWPVAEPADLDKSDDQGAQHLAWQAERARRVMTLGSIRADLEAQPSPTSVLSAARRWCTEITALAEDVAQALKKTG